MLNKNLLLAEMVRNGMTQEELAKAIGMPRTTLYRRLKKGVFGTDEAEKIIAVLHIEDPGPIFFDKKVTY